MALITCAECSAKVSDQAPACISCGAPLHASGRRPTTIQATGKDAKLITLLGGLLIFGSIILIFMRSVPDHVHYAAWSFAIGLVLRVYGRIMAWWKYH